MQSRDSDYDREDFRMFKLNRMENLCCTGETFERQEVPPPDISTEKIFPVKCQVKAVFAPECKWRLQEEFGKESFSIQEDGNLFFSFGFTDRENLLSWILTFGDKAELLKPKAMRGELQRIGYAICRKYEEERTDNPTEI